MIDRVRNVAGSTRLLQEHGDAYAVLLEQHRVIVRSALSRHSGVEVDTQGVAMALAGHGDSALALELAAAVQALWRSLGTDLHVRFWDNLLERYLAEARTAAGAEADAAWARGLALEFDEAVALALQR